MFKKVNPFDSNFYDKQIIASYNSANIIVPILIDLFNPKSVVDVGCGMGTWLKSFQENGIKDFLGFDGDYINIKKLLIPTDNFQSKDLRKKIEIDLKFDLVISLEVAEHLPSESSDIFVETLTNLGSIIYFSAGIPFQGGTNHINERWQSYWAAKFALRGFLPFDLIRSQIWSTNKVQTCYAQNGIVYVNKAILTTLDQAKIDIDTKTNIDDLSIVHPRIYEDLVDPLRQTVRLQFNFFMRVLVNRIKQRLKIT